MSEKNTLPDVQIEFTDGTFLICSPKSAVYIIRGLKLQFKDDGKSEKTA